MSPLKTATLREFTARADTQCEQRVDKIRVTEVALEGVESAEVQRRLQACIGRARRFIQSLLAQRNDLEQIAYEAAEGQVHRFNEIHRTDANYAPWDTQFMQLADLPKDERDTAWQRLPGGTFKRLQECFCTRGQRVLPRERRMLEDQDLCTDGMILDPECVPDDLAAKLGIVAFEESDSPMDRWRKKQDPAAIEALRGLLRGARQLERGNCRLIVLTDGRILYTSENGNGRGGNGNRPERRSQVFDAYGAHRKTHHEHNVYEREIGVLEEVRVKLEGLQPLIDSWRRDTPEARKREIEAQALPVIAECSEKLSAAVNVYKRIAGNTLEKIEDFTIERRDGRRVVNPPAVMARLVGVRNNLSRRFEEMLGKGSYNERDGMVLQREIQRSEQVFSLLRARLAQSTPGNASVIAQEQTFHALRGVRTAPFRTYAEKILAVQSAHLAPALQQGSAEGCRDGLVRAYVIAKFQEVGSGFARMKARMLTLEHLQVFEVKQLADELAQLFRSIDIFPGQRVEGYVQPFETLCGELAEIQHGLAHYEGQQLDAEGRRALFERFREYLEKFDLEEIVRNLP
ncbi:MAG: hypothetical protein PHO92_00920 [Candidatus Peribacteraceae bacterium]|nr:hypothetical protein [Candidatus Peribacteraceae bacterium]